VARDASTADTGKRSVGRSLARRAHSRRDSFDPIRSRANPPASPRPSPVRPISRFQR
jgi:hypothetical protein